MKRIVTAALLPVAAAVAQHDHVIVALDMDPRTPGIQSSTVVRPGNHDVLVDVYAYDPKGGRWIMQIGYIGGIDRGIALGHAPTPGNRGRIDWIRGTAGTPITSGGTGIVWHDPLIEKGFEGPEVQYVEVGGVGEFPLAATHPMFSARIGLFGGRVGDIFDFHLLDFVTVWRGGGSGAFTSLGSTNWLDSGGDAVPDGTRTRFGVDPDVFVPAPPARFTVDYRDGPPGGGPGTIVVAEACYPDCDTSTGLGILDIFDFLCFLNHFNTGAPYACDCKVTGPGVCDIWDFLCFQNEFAKGCR